MSATLNTSTVKPNALFALFTDDELREIFAWWPGGRHVDAPGFRLPDQREAPHHTP